MGTVRLDPKNLSVWEANIKEMKTLQPQLAFRLEQWVEQHGHSFEHDENVTPKGIWVSGLSSQPFFQPNDLPKKPWKKAEENRVSVVLLYGIGIAPWLFRMARALPTNTLAVVVLEPELSLLAYLLHTTNIYLAVPEGCRLSFAVDSLESMIEETLEVNITKLGTYVFSSAYVWTHPGEAEVFKEAMLVLQKGLRERVVTKLQELGNAAEDTLLGLRQAALSAPWIVLRPSLDSIMQEFRGRPFIWVASGPSLDNNIHFLRENEDRAVLICADTVAAKLLGAGIVPDILVSLERGMAVYTYLEKLRIQYPEETQKILLVSQAVCVPEVAAKWPGPSIVVGKKEIPVDQWMVGEVMGGSLIFSGLSVAHMGIWLAVYMGASSIALTGQDLAFGENRRSHAGATVTEATAKAEAEGSLRILKSDYEVPAALGGTVVTHEIWFLFLRVLERYIAVFNVPVFDCTEGGALIQGTIVKPLTEWMGEHLEGLEPLSEKPAAIVARQKMTSAQRREAVERVIYNTGLSIAFVRESEKKLDDLGSIIERVAAPGLSPAQRRTLASELGKGLDSFHIANPVLDFIGQSQVTLNAATIAKNRLLEDVEAVREWKRVHEEIIKGHRYALSVMEAWLKYLAVAVDVINENWDKGFSTDPLPFYLESSISDPQMLEQELGVLSALEQLRVLGEADTEFKKLSSHILLDNLIARADHKWWREWDKRIDWKIGLALELEGRNAEAVVFMNRMETQSMEVFGLPHDAAVAFLKDYGRITASNDLCYVPNFDKARLYVQNAVELEPEDTEARELLKEINEKALRYYTNRYAVIIDPDKISVDRISHEWHLDRTKVEVALADGDLVLAFSSAWEMVKKFILVIPQGAADYLMWLTSQMVRLELENVEEDIKLRAIRDEILQWMPLFKEANMSVAPGFTHNAEESALENIEILVEQESKA